MNFVSSLIGEEISIGPNCVAPIPACMPPLNCRGNFVPPSRATYSSTWSSSRSLSPMEIVAALAVRKSRGRLRSSSSFLSPFGRSGLSAVS
jgi:hypothetical protein